MLLYLLHAIYICIHQAHQDQKTRAHLERSLLPEMVFLGHTLSYLQTSLQYQLSLKKCSILGASHTCFTIFPAIEVLFKQAIK